MGTRRFMLAVGQDEEPTSAAHPGEKSLGILFAQLASGER
jgi:hypothetical protein